MIAQLKKGVLELCILSIISKKEIYGYEIIKQISTAFYDTAEQTVYTILRRLLKEEYTECFSKGISDGPPRKYYRLTSKGKIYLKQYMGDWEYIANAVKIISQE